MRASLPFGYFTLVVACDSHLVFWELKSELPCVVVAPRHLFDCFEVHVLPKYDIHLQRIYPLRLSDGMYYLIINTRCHIILFACLGMNLSLILTISCLYRLLY